jgi:hypothetical protein
VYEAPRGDSQLPPVHGWATAEMYQDGDYQPPTSVTHVPQAEYAAAPVTNAQVREFPAGSTNRVDTISTSQIQLFEDTDPFDSNFRLSSIGPGQNTDKKNKDAAGSTVMELQATPFDILVAGAAGKGAQINGWYRQVGQFMGKPKFRHVCGRSIIYCRRDVWRINEVYEAFQSDSQVPPSHGWATAKIYQDDDHQPPTVTHVPQAVVGDSVRAREDFKSSYGTPILKNWMGIVKRKYPDGDAWVDFENLADLVVDNANVHLLEVIQACADLEIPEELTSQELTSQETTHTSQQPVDIGEVNLGFRSEARMRSVSTVREQKWFRVEILEIGLDSDVAVEDISCAFVDCDRMAELARVSNFTRVEHGLGMKALPLQTEEFCFTRNQKFSLVVRKSSTANLPEPAESSMMDGINRAIQVIEHEVGRAVHAVENEVAHLAELAHITAAKDRPKLRDDEEYEDAIAKTVIRSESFFDLGFWDYLELESPRGATPIGKLLLKITPLSQSVGLPFATLANDSEYMIADKIVTHTWGDKFFHMMGAVLADALNLFTYQEISEKMSDGQFDNLRSQLEKNGKMTAAYWICCFSVNQHAAICGDNLPAPCKCRTKKFLRGEHSEMNKFDHMMLFLKVKHIDICHQEGDPLRKRFGELVAADTDFTIFERIWCVAELVEADKSNIDQIVKVHSFSAFQEKRGKVEDIDVDQSKATCEADKVMILNKISDKKRFNEKVKRLLRQKFNSIEAFALSAAAMSAFQVPDVFGQTDTLDTADSVPV